MEEQKNEVQEQVADESVDEQQEVQQEDTQTTKQQDETRVQDDTDDDDSYGYQYEPSQTEIPALDFSNLPTGEDGTLDAAAFQQAINQYGQQVFQTASQSAQQQAAQTYQMMRAEEKAWEKIQKDYPEVAESKNLKRIIHNQRNADVINGGDGNLVKAARSVMDEFRGARSQGKTQAQESIKIQQSAHLESSGVTNEPKSTSTQQLRSQAMNGRGKERDAARRQLLKQMIKDGKI